MKFSSSHISLVFDLLAVASSVNGKLGWRSIKNPKEQIKDRKAAEWASVRISKSFGKIFFLPHGISKLNPPYSMAHPYFGRFLTKSTTTPMT
jgi:hypothetical protein